MKKHTLQGEPRTETGRKTKKLRKIGLIPATVYGKNVDSESFSVKHEDFVNVYSETGETGLIELSAGKLVRPVLVHKVQKDPVTGQLLHIEFHQVDLKEKVHAEIPLTIEGTAPAVEQKTGLLIQVLNSLGVEALPAELPEHISVDVTSLSNVGDELRVSDLKIPKEVTVTSDATLSVARIAPLPQEEVIAPPPPAEGEVAPEVAAEGEEAQPEEPSEQKPEEQK